MSAQVVHYYHSGSIDSAMPTVSVNADNSRSWYQLGTGQTVVALRLRSIDAMVCVWVAGKTV